ncbi:hypothetical protein ZIOFF_035344 [Zingiber officinale]|uniref:Uncharacterized protein n=1 Tax=Zingiber officinale TaxID=94328 RepID=A0A8J5G8S0_ZINOF|nr:hypothetical protein ZIOFF_035344 [Zingiber officinale]
MEAAVRRGMARMWLWDGQGKASRWLLDAMVEHLSPLATGNTGVLDTSRATFYSNSCWAEEVQLAQFVHYCEADRPGVRGAVEPSDEVGVERVNVGRRVGILVGAALLRVSIKE